MSDIRLTEGVSILRDGLREKANEIASKGYRIDFLNGAILNYVNYDDTSDVVQNISSKLAEDLYSLKDNFQPLIREFSDNYKFFITKLDKKNEYTPNNIIYVDVPALVKYLIADNAISDSDGNIPFEQLNRETNIIAGSYLDSSYSESNTIQDFYAHINPEYRSYAEEILVTYDESDLSTLIRTCLQNVDSNNINIRNMFTMPALYIKDLCIVYIILDYLRSKAEDVGVSFYIDIYKTLVGNAMFKFDQMYTTQMKNDILIIDPFIYYSGSDPKILVNKAVFNKFLEICKDYEATNIIFANVYNEKTRRNVTIEQIMENAEETDKVAKDVYNLIYEKNKLANYEVAKQKIIELFDMLLIDANEEFYSIVGKDSLTLKGILLNKLTNNINYMNPRLIVDFIVKGVIFDSINEFNPCSLFVRYLYSQSGDHDYDDIYTTSLVKVILDILMSSLTFVGTPISGDNQ